MKRFLAIALTLAMAFAMVACGNTTNDTANSNGNTTGNNSSNTGDTSSDGGRTVYKLGAPTMLTGSAAMKGISGMQAAKIAVDEINEAGGINGIPVELVIEDTASDTSQAI